jgi:CTP:molybdopterin cytidylyltransferase MocA
MKTQHSRIGAIVVAVATSGRMGKPKQLLRPGGQTMLGKQPDKIRTSCCALTAPVFIGFNPS